MDAGSLGKLDWGAVALTACIAAALVWALIFFLRQNSKDLDDLQETLDAQREEDEE